MKKINKRSCRAYADPQLKIKPNHSLLIADQYDYIVRTATKNIAGQRLLLIYIYSREQVVHGQINHNQSVPLWIVFQSKTEHYTLTRKADGSTVWRTGRFECMNADYSFEKKCVFYSLKDRERLERYCQGAPASGFSALSCLQNQIADRCCREKQTAKDQKTIKRMAVLPALPRGLNSWIHRQMPVYLFYDYQKKKGTQSAYCTGCRREVAVNAPKHNAEDICPRCRQKATFKSRGKRGHIWNRETCQVVQKLSSDELVVRVIKIYDSFLKRDEPIKNIIENARFFIHAGETPDCLTEPYYLSRSKGILTLWQPGIRPRPPLSGYWYDDFEASDYGYLYTKNLAESLCGTKWQYCQLQPYYVREPERLSVTCYLHTYIKYPMLEYLVKLRLQRLADCLVFEQHLHSRVFNLSGHNIREILGIEREHLPFLQSANPDATQFQFIRAIIQQTGHINEELLEWCGKHDFHDSDIMKFLLAVVKPQKLMHYAAHQFSMSSTQNDPFRKMDALLTLYRDYIRMCQQLKYDLSNDFLLFPRYLQKSHDKVSDLIDMRNTAVYNQQIKAQFSLLQGLYQFTHGGFTVILPHTAREIVQEGHKLRHCVGSYVSSVAGKKCTILFIRKEKTPWESLCTVEIRDNEIKQARCFKNQDPSDEILEFIELWGKKVLRVPEKKYLAA